MICDADKNALLIVIACLSLIGAIKLILYYLKLKKQLDCMWAVDTYSAQELNRMCKGNFRATVEVEGMVSCEKPIIAPYSQLSCCWYRIKIEERQNTGRRGRWVVVSDHEYSSVFEVNDQTGSVMVLPQGAEIDAVQTYKGPETKPIGLLQQISFIMSSSRRATEYVFLPQGYAYVLGQASWNGNKALIHCPNEGYLDPKNKVFIISRMSEGQRTAMLSKRAQLSFWFAILCGTIFFASAYSIARHCLGS